jgi:hypothetical protein
LKADLSTFRMVPLIESLNFQFIQQNINDQNEFVVNEISEKAAAEYAETISSLDKRIESYKGRQRVGERKKNAVNCLFTENFSVIKCAQDHQNRHWNCAPGFQK